MAEITITSFKTHDVRFPTSLTGDGTDAMNTDCDYSAAYIIFSTSSESLKGYGMTFTIGRGNDIVCSAITALAQRFVGRPLESLFENMGKTWDEMVSDPQMRWLGPEKGVVHIACGAVNNALWDLYARVRRKPLWKLVVDMSSEEIIKSCAWRYLSDVITKEEAIAMLKKNEATKKEREELVRKSGYPAYVTSAGWLGYSDEKIATLTKAAIKQGFTHFKMKVGADLKDDVRRGLLIRSLIDDPELCKDRGKSPLAATIPDLPEDLTGKNPGPTGSVLMVDANQVWDVPQAIEWVKGLNSIRPWFIEEPTAPDDILGHKAIKEALKNIPTDDGGSITIGVATGEHAHSRVLFKQLIQAGALDVVQIDSCRLAGVSEVLSVMLIASKFGLPVCPHAGGVGLCEYVIHLSLIDYICISASLDRNVLEYVDHLHEHFVYRCNINERGRYIIPDKEEEGYSIEMYPESIKEFEWPHGSYWAKSNK